MKRLKKHSLRIAFFSVGIALLALGIVVTMLSKLGVSTWDAVYIGAYELFGISLSFWVNVECVLLIVLAAIIAKEKMHYDSIVVTFILGFFIELFSIAFKGINITSVFMQVTTFCIGILLIGLGIGTYLCAKYSSTPVDNLMLSIKKRYAYSIMLSMTLCEILGLIFAFLVNGPIGIGTLVSAIAFGPCIQICHSLAQSFYIKMEKLCFHVHNAVDMKGDDKDS